MTSIPCYPAQPDEFMQTSRLGVPLVAAESCADRCGRVEPERSHSGRGEEFLTRCGTNSKKDPIGAKRFALARGVL